MNDQLRISFMQQALHEAQKAYEIGEVPIGAVIVHDGKIISKAHNLTEREQNPLFHAELLAIQEASTKLNSRRLHDCSLFVTLEPCSMCAGAIILARIPNVYIACKDSKSGAVTSLYELLTDSRLNHRCSIHFGTLEDESSRLLQSFFRDLRKGDIVKTQSTRVL